MKRFPLKSSLLALGFALLAAVAAQASLNYDLYILQTGDGVEVTSSYAPITISHFTSDGATASHVESWTAPSTDPASRITLGASFTTGNMLTRSVDGNYLAFIGRNTPVGAGATAGEEVVIATFALTGEGRGSFNTSTRLTGLTATTTFRSAATIDGTQFWYAGRGGGGVRYANLGDSVANDSLIWNQSTDVPHNIETAGVQIVGGSIVFSRRAGSDRGLYHFGGMPTSGLNERILVDGSGWERTSASTLSSYNDFKLYNGNTLFVAASSNLLVYTLDDITGDWNRLTGASQTLEDLKGEVNLDLIDRGSDALIFLTAGAGNADSELLSVVWDPMNMEFSSPVLLATTTGTGHAFGGIVAIPEPSTIAAILGLLALATVIVRRRRQN